MLYGPPGNGKTRIAIDTAIRHGRNILFIKVKPELTIELLINTINMVSDTKVIVFDDFEAVFKDQELDINVSRDIRWALFERRGHLYQCK